MIGKNIAPGLITKFLIGGVAGDTILIYGKLTVMRLKIL